MDNQSNSLEKHLFSQQVQFSNIYYFPIYLYSSILNIFILARKKLIEYFAMKTPMTFPIQSDPFYNPYFFFYLTKLMRKSDAQMTCPSDQRTIYLRCFTHILNAYLQEFLNHRSFWNSLVCSYCEGQFINLASIDYSQYAYFPHYWSQRCYWASHAGNLKG